jgi:trimeric autotransporter adhesin
MKSKRVCFALAILLGVSVAHAQVTGSGTLDYVPLWTSTPAVGGASTTTLGDSLLFQTDVGIGIGTKKPDAKLDVENASTTRSAIFGQNSATSGNVDGVFGVTNSPNGNGVLGIDNATTGFAVGVTGITNSSDGSGLNGFSTTSSGGIGVTGQAPTSGTAIFGVNQVCSSSSCKDVAGTAGYFVTGAGGTLLAGAVGTVSGAANTTMFSVDSSGDGYFAGNLNVTGNLTKGSGAFKIDDPLDPANKYLSHSFVESPDMMNLYNGVVVLDANGEAFVKLPEYFQALNSDFRYQLTAIGAPGPNLYIAEEISGNHFKIAGGKAGAKVSWQVTGIRQDAYAKAHPIKVEEDKPVRERGHYLHPELFGATEKEAIRATSLPPASPAPQVSLPVTVAKMNEANRQN